MTAEAGGQHQHRKGYGRPSAFVPHGIAWGIVGEYYGGPRPPDWFGSGCEPVVGLKVSVMLMLREQMPDDGEFGFTTGGHSMCGHIIEVLPDQRFRAELKTTSGPMRFRGRWMVELRHDRSYRDPWVLDAMLPFKSFTKKDYFWEDAARAMETGCKERLRYAQLVQRRGQRSAPQKPAPSARAGGAPAKTMPTPALPPKVAPKSNGSGATIAVKLTKPNTVFTVGHSNHPVEKLITLLRAYEVTAVADVRSTPASTRNPQFNAQALQRSLKDAGISYAFLGKELGARAEDPSCYVEGKVQYDRLASTAQFKAGLDRVVQGAKRFRIALVCAEKDPLVCHRMIVVARHLVSRGLGVAHILGDGRLEPHEAALDRLLVEIGLNGLDLLLSRDELVEQAYRKRGAEISYVEAPVTVDAGRTGPPA